MIQFFYSQSNDLCMQILGLISEYEQVEYISMNKKENQRLYPSIKIIPTIIVDGKKFIGQNCLQLLLQQQNNNVLQCFLMRSIEIT